MSQPNRKTEQGSSPDQVEQFVQLYSRHQRHLRYYILTLVPNFSEADDVLQETNLVLWRKFASFEQGTSFYAWARRVAYFQSLKSREKASRGPALLGEKVIELLAEDAVKTTNELDARFSAVRVCMKKLGDSDRQLIEQRYLHEIMGKDIAKELGRPVNSVYKSLGRIRRALQLCVRRHLASSHRQGGGYHE